MTKNKKIYKLISVSKYGIEQIDETETLTEAKNLKKEYQIAFGSDFFIKIKHPYIQTLLNN